MASLRSEDRKGRAHPREHCYSAVPLRWIVDQSSTIAVNWGLQCPRGRGLHFHAAQRHGFGSVHAHGVPGRIAFGYFGVEARIR